MCVQWCSNVLYSIQSLLRCSYIVRCGSLDMKAVNNNSYFARKYVAFAIVVSLISSLVVRSIFERLTRRASRLFLLILIRVSCSVPFRIPLSARIILAQQSHRVSYLMLKHSHVTP
uniref:Uncharacterized protein n=1 Tax=Rhipicephalus zambeziensis TaxID=60191 RepID=A0A224YFY2_9ACAR